MLKKLKGVDITKLSPDQMKKLAGALAQSTKKTQQASSGMATAKKSIATAKSALKSGKGELADIED